MSELKIIAHIHTDFPEKFGIPRQSGLIEELSGRIVFEPEYRSEDALRGIEGYDYLWLLWAFEGTERGHWSATVTPPRLGGKRTMGVLPRVRLFVRIPSDFRQSGLTRWN